MASLGHGQVWWADLDDDKIRPVVVLTRAVVAPRLRRVVVAPITSTVRGIATEVPVGADEGVRAGSVANLDNVQLLAVDRLLRQVGTVATGRWPLTHHRRQSTSIPASVVHVLRADATPESRGGPEAGGRSAWTGRG
jgi:mRNA interferase MazF